MMENATSCSVRNKIEKISQLLGEITPKRSETNENDNTVDSSAFAAFVSHTSDGFYERLASFGPGQWRVREVTPLECARYGWKLIQPDVIQCGTCRQIVCANLPLATNRQAYSEFLDKLKKQVVDGHHEACWWRHNPCPRHLARPPQPATLEDLHNLANTAHILKSLESVLPHLDIPTIMTQMGVDGELLGKLHSTQDISTVQMTSALLTLSGWSKGDGAYLRCKSCCRSVGLWSFVSQADDGKSTGPTKRCSESPVLTPRKHKTSELEGSGEESVFASPEKHVEPENTQAQWRMRLRERRVSDQNSSDEAHPRRRKGSDRSRKGSTSSLSDAKEESVTPLIIDTPPPIQKQEIQIPKQLFHPLEEHRPWCPWIIKDEDMEVKGYQMVLSKVKEIIKQSEGNSCHFAEKIDGNVEGVRLLRALLDDVGTELQPME